MALQDNEYKIDLAKTLLRDANLSLVKVWQMTAGADGNERDRIIFHACVAAQTHIDEAMEALEGDDEAQGD